MLMRIAPSLALLAVLFFFSIPSFGQLVSGPMLGQVELRTAKIWIEVRPGTSVELWYSRDGNPAAVQKLTAVTNPSAWFVPLTFDLVGLDMNTTYNYQFFVSFKTVKMLNAGGGQFTTQKLWQWRNPAPDFSFLTGSCAYFNEPIYDRPGKPYGGDSSIFEAMAKEKSAFMLWLGDNWYTREADYNSEWGLWYRASHDRSLPVLQNFWKSMPQYAIWDDHDYGPNDADKSYVFKEASRKVFMNYWCNPSYGFNGEGIYSKVTYGDADLFLMDDRYFRSADAMSPNPDKRMWGATQMDWLKNSLLNSKAVFKFIVTGSQTLNPVSPYDCLQEYPVEFHDLMSFLSAEKISGIVFLTGDRHHSEVIKYERSAGYSLYDVTSSPFTSGISKVGGKELNNPYRVANTLVEEQNYTRIRITGPKDDRKLTVEFIGIKGQKLADWSVSEIELK